MKGYKGFDKDLKCKNYQYEVGMTYRMHDDIKVCKRGYHFCKELIDVMDYYNSHDGNRFCEVEALGKIKTDDNKKYCTNIIKIIREIPIEEVLKKVNSGSGNSGDRNSGSGNSGSWNSGSWNSGSGNSGSGNSGDRNSGDRNSGSGNSGSWNSGSGNSGDRNSGSGNSGSWNSGLFNTDEPNARLFNKMSNVKMSEIDIWRINNILSFIDKRDVKLVWKYTEDMTKEEKENYPEHTTTGGALMKVEVKADVQEEWERVSEDDKNFIKSLPNFDADIFYECTGIRV